MAADRMVTGPDTGVNNLVVSVADGAVTRLGADQARTHGRGHGEPDWEQLAKLRPRRK